MSIGNTIRAGAAYVEVTAETSKVNYDRGWDVRPKTPEAKAVLSAIIKNFN